MKLLIDIPEHIYEHAKESSEDSRDEFDAMRAIANGTQQESCSEIPNTCGDAISRQAVFDVTWEEPSYTDALNVLTEVREKVRALPSITPQQRTGRWIAYEVQLPDRTILNYRCSVCGRKLIGYSTETLSEAPFCHCGAKMEVEE